MTYEQAAQIALETAQRDGMTRWVYLSQRFPSDQEQWRVTILYSEVGNCPAATIVPQAREYPPKPQATDTRK